MFNQNNSIEKEAELLKKFSESKDLKYLGDIFSPYLHLVYGVSLKYLKNREEAQDAVLEIFEKLIQEIPKQEIENFKAWLYVLTKNFCLMQLRKRKAFMGKEQQFIADYKSFMESEEKLHPIDEDHSNLNKLLQDCLKKLKKEQKECVRMFYYENRSYQEISELLGIPVKDIKSRLQNGKRNLKICIENTNE